MTHWQICGSKCEATALVWSLMLSQGSSRNSAEGQVALELEKTLQWNQKPVGSVGFAPDGKTVAGFGLDWEAIFATGCT